MKNFILGICFGTIGITILSTMSDVIVNGAELAKAKIGVEITKCNAQINQLSAP